MLSCHETSAPSCKKAMKKQIFLCMVLIQCAVVFVASEQKGIAHSLDRKINCNCCVQQSWSKQKEKQPRKSGLWILFWRISSLSDQNKTKKKLKFSARRSVQTRQLWWVLDFFASVCHCMGWNFEPCRNVACFLLFSFPTCRNISQKSFGTFGVLGSPTLAKQIFLKWWIFGWFCQNTQRSGMRPYFFVFVMATTLFFAPR